MAIIRPRRSINFSPSSVSGAGVVTPSGGGGASPPTFIFALPQSQDYLVGNASHMPFFVGFPYSWHIINYIEDPNSLPMTISAFTPLPAGFSVDPVNCLLVWDGTGVAGQTDNLQLKVTNSLGASSLSKIFTIKVFNQAQFCNAALTSYPPPQIYNGAITISVLKHSRMEVCPLNGRVYWCGGDYNGGQGQNQSARWELWSFDPDAPTNWRLEYPYFGPAGDVQPAGPDEACFVWDPQREMFLSGPGNYGFHSGLVRSGFATGIAQDHLCGFSPNTGKWTDLGLITGPFLNATAVYGRLVGRQLFGGGDYDTTWTVDVDALTSTLVNSGPAGYVGYSEQCAFDGGHTMYFYDFRGRLLKADTTTRVISQVLLNMPSAGRLWVEIVWNADQNLLEVWIPEAGTGWGQMIVIDPITLQWGPVGVASRGNVTMHYPGKGTFHFGGESYQPLTAMNKIVVTR